MNRSHTEISEEKKAPRWEYLYKLVSLIHILIKISLLKSKKRENYKKKRKNRKMINLIQSALLHLSS